MEGAAKKFVVPSLATHKILASSDMAQITTREEQEQYKIRGMQDGKVDELMRHEKREQRKLLHKTQSNKAGEDQNQAVKEEEILEQGPSDNDSLKDKIDQQDKKKKRKKRKNKKAAEQEDAPPAEEEKKDPKNNERFKHNIQASHDLYADSNDDSEDEGIKEYQVGGYHPVHLGEVLIGRYVIVQKLGWGQFSTVWLAKDMKYNNTFVALKVQKSAPSYKVAAYDEVEILDVIAKNIKNPEWIKSLGKYHGDEECGKVNGQFTSQHTQVVQLLNSFMHYGANGDHFIMVFEILGVNLLEIMKRYDYKGIPIPLVRRISKQILIGLDYLHRICKIIHTDLKPENTIVALSNDSLAEIVKNGQIPKSRKKYEQSKKLHLDKTSLFDHVKQPQHHGATLLEGVNTQGLTKQQKKKLKRKIKKGQQKEEDSQDEASQNGSMTVRESEAKMNNRTQATYEQMLLMNENEEDLQWQRPRSHSLPNLLFKDHEDDPFDSDESPQKQKSNYVFNLERNFGYEIQEYILMRREIQKRKERLKNGELDPEDLKNNTKGKDPRDIELSKKQNVDVSGPMIDEDINAKICDLGNGCWTHYHFVPKIQTRQYRAPEVILGIDYDESTDLWSYACMVFELITGDFLFNPRPGDNHKKNDDHLALFMEMLGPMPKKMAMQGNMFEHYFKRNPTSGKYYFKRIHDLVPVNLEQLLITRYFFKPNEAHMLADFLMKILQWYPADRPSAQEMLKHPWLTMADNYNYKMSDMEQKLYELKDQKTQIDNYEPDMNYLMEQKANLMNANNQHHVQMDLDDIERMIAKKTAQSGNRLYRYPGQLAESDEEQNGADLEDYATQSSGDDDTDSNKSWAQSEGSNFSFNSEKLIDGYKDFQVFQKKMQAKKAQEEVEAAKHGGFGKSKTQKKKKSKKPKKSKKNEDNPFGRKTSPTSEEANERSRSPSLVANADYTGKLVFEKKNEEEPECELNLSFSGGYVPNTDLSRVDKGLGNPQFCGVDLN